MRAVRAALGHQREHLALARRQLARADRAAAAARAAARTTSGSSAVPPPATRRDRVEELGDVGDAVLEQVADAARVADEQLGGVALLDVLREHEDRDVRVQRARITSAARMPSSVWVGGIRTSTITRSGCSRRPRAAARRASPTAATTS